MELHVPVNIKKTFSKIILIVSNRGWVYWKSSQITKLKKYYGNALPCVSGCYYHTGYSDVNYCREIVETIISAKKLVESKKYTGLLIGGTSTSQKLNGMMNVWGSILLRTSYQQIGSWTACTITFWFKI
jgi:hypothetical protein